jgi:hypothetical protein
MAKTDTGLVPKGWPFVIQFLVTGEGMPGWQNGTIAVSFGNNRRPELSLVQKETASV